MIAVQSQDFCQQTLYDQVRQAQPNAGAIVTFTGLVRDYNQQGNIEGIELEYYPGMTEHALTHLAANAQSQFAVLNVSIVHRIGRIANHEQIVWVGVAAHHRKAAFDAACFVMDMLKQSVPLWKKEWQNGEAEWVAAKESDALAAMSWLPSKR